MRRIETLTTGVYYHIFNRSIAGFKIYNNHREYKRFLETLIYYQHSNRPIKYSGFKVLTIASQNKIIQDKDPAYKLTSIICYCLMPTHFHLILMQEQNEGVVKHISNIQNSYSKFFNTVHKRKGPLWESRFKSVRVENNEQLLHLTRYIHLNPTSANIVDKPEDWEYSSYREYIELDNEKKICEYEDVLNIIPKDYKKIVNERKKYQQELSIIKSKLIDNYTG